MRVLVYGGCHAVAIADIMNRAAPGHHFDSLLNFDLINRGVPFPYERLSAYDAVVYSPVRNKDEWNTSHLVERAQGLGLKLVSYPWLQWNGYFPNVSRPTDIPPHVWCLQGLVDLLAEGAPVERLFAEAHTGERFTSAAKPYAEYSSSTLREHEADVDVRISGFIEEQFRHQRLFATPDHPKAPLYAYVCAQIAERLGLRVSLHDIKDPHRDIFPILPAVGAALGLQFTSTDYVIEHPPLGPLPLLQYLARLRSDYVTVHGEPVAAPALELPAGQASPAPFSSRRPSPSLGAVRQDAPAVVRIVHEMEFGGLFEVPFNTTKDACVMAVTAARSGKHRSVSLRSDGYDFPLSDLDAAELLVQWA